jgi:hypothetical protein
MPMSRENLRIDSVDDAVVEMLRGKSPVECVAMMGEANEMARLLAAAGIRYLHPDWSTDQVSAAVARRMLGDPD